MNGASRCLSVNDRSHLTDEQLEVRILEAAKALMSSADATGDDIEFSEEAIQSPLDRLRRGVRATHGWQKIARDTVRCPTDNVTAVS